MIDYKYFDLFWHKRGSVNKDWKIEYDGGSFTDWDMEDESLELTESLCSETELRFGCCEASCLKFTVANIVRPLINEWITLSVVIDHHDSEPLMIGKYKVASEKPTADRRYKEIVAYDVMYDIISPDVADWYNSILPEKASTTTLKKFRESFVRHFGLTEVLPKDGLVNDGMTVKKTIMPEQISGLDVITAICEINGCFGHIGRDGKFHYIYLPQAIQGLYPADNLFPDHAPDSMPYQQQTGHLYPQDPKGVSIDSNHYIDVDWENFYVQHITKLQIRQEENDIGVIYGTGDNCYIIQDNFLVYGKSSEELQTIAANIFEKITNIVYNPLKSADVLGNPCLEVGDAVRFPTKYEVVESYILQRTLKGIQALRDNYQSNGVEKYSEEVNGVHKSIIQLKGKANILTRTLEETKLEMYDIADGLNNTITVTAKEIRAELKNEVDGLKNTITITAGQIRSELQNTKDGLESSITQTASQIRTEVANSDANLQSQITQNAGEIALRVTKDGVVSSINMSPESITIKAGKIDLQGLVNADELVSKFATITTLNAVSARVDRIDADYASIGDLNAESASIQNIFSQKIEAVDAKFQSLNASNITSGTLSADRINAASLSIGANQITGTARTVIPQLRYSTISCMGPDGEPMSFECVTDADYQVVYVVAT